MLIWFGLSKYYMKVRLRSRSRLRSRLRPRSRLRSRLRLCSRFRYLCVHVTRLPREKSKNKWRLGRAELVQKSAKIATLKGPGAGLNFKWIFGTPKCHQKLSRVIFGLPRGTLKNQRTAKSSPKNNIRALFGAPGWSHDPQKLILGGVRKLIRKLTSKAWQNRPL